VGKAKPVDWMSEADFGVGDEPAIGHSPFVREFSVIRLPRPDGPAREPVIIGTSQKRNHPGMIRRVGC
jgi:hypothetical protein